MGFPNPFSGLFGGSSSSSSSNSQYQPSPWQQPQAQPTPYQPPSKGGNPYIVPGTEGPYVPASATPTNNGNGSTSFSNGSTYQSNKVLSQPIQSTTQVSSGQQNSGSASGGFDMSAFPGYAGWSYEAALADWKATGGAGKGASGSSGGSTNPQNDIQIRINGQDTTAKDKGPNGEKANAVDENGTEYFDSSIPSLDDQANWIFQDLDSLVANYPGQQQALNEQAELQAQQQVDSATANKDDSLKQVGTAQDTETKRAAGTLREMAQNANDLLARLQQLYGGGSPAEAAMTGMGRTINQQRGGILTNRDSTLQTLEGKKLAIDDVWKKQKESIDQWKKGKLLEIATTVQGWVNEIAQSKTNVRAQLSARAVTSAQNLLNQLQLQNDAYNKSVDQWQRERSAEIEDYKTKLQLNQQYNPGNYNWDLNPNKTSNTSSSFNWNSGSTTDNPLVDGINATGPQSDLMGEDNVWTSLGINPKDKEQRNA